MSEPEKPSSSGPPVLLGCVIFIVLGLAGCGALVAFGKSSGPDHNVDAQVMCERFVKDQLKSPATADFSEEVTTKGADKVTYSVAGAVDSQNSFGAKIRNTYSCTVRMRPNGKTWDLVSLTGLSN